MTENSATLIWCLLIGYVVISVLNLSVLAHFDKNENQDSIIILMINTFPGLNLLISIYTICVVIRYFLNKRKVVKENIKDEYHKEVPSNYDVYRGFPGIAISMMYKPK